MSMAISKAIRQQACKDIACALSRHGPRYDLNQFWLKKYSEVPRSTWHRWVKRVRDSGIPGKKAALRAKKKAAQRARQPDSQKPVAMAAKDQLPEVVRPGDITGGTGLVSVVDRIQSCIQHAEKVVALCEMDDGKIRNPKLYLIASRHILEAMKVAANITRQLMEAQRLEQFHETILNRLKERDPVLIEQILDDLEQLNREWGAV